ncbi:N-acetylmuramoyl-L-alanine amidase [Candidatus Sumerlaeota bacterium]|nr:N-acetylmuramoyl-L-alanine amidase [Candidatus Sumerlaeota bacterium]
MRLKRSSVQAGSLLLPAFILCIVGNALSAFPQNSSAVPELNIVYPREGRTYYGAYARFSGATQPGNTVSVQDEEVEVFASGAFAGRVPLEPGDNTLLFRAENPAGQTTERTLRIYRAAPLKPSPADPPQFDKEYAATPDDSIELPPGAEIIVRVKGSPGMCADFRIGSPKPAIPMRELDAKEGGVAGVYEGSYLLQPDDEFVRASITVFLRRKPDAKAVAEWSLPNAKISVLKNKTPILYEARRSTVDLYTGPNMDKPYIEADINTWLEYTGCIGNKLQFRLAPNQSAWGKDQFFNRLDEPHRRPAGRLDSISVRRLNRAQVVRLSTGQRCAWTVFEAPEANTLTIRIYACQLDSFWDHRSSKGDFQDIRARQAEDSVVDVEIITKDRPAWGYDVAYDGGVMEVSLFDPPLLAASPEKPLSGMAIVLSPGHGGSDSGALGGTGLEEKKANVQLAELIAQRIEQLGGEVRWIKRDADEAVDLDERVTRAGRLGGDLFVSVHNDSVSLYDDPLAYRGSSLFYTHTQSKRLAMDIYDQLLLIDTAPSPRGVYQRDLRVTRKVTRMPSALVECRYLSHPADEMDLLSAEQCGRIADAIVRGIVNFMQQTDAP